MIDTQFIYIFIHAKFSQSINKPPSMNCPMHLWTN